MTQCYRRNCHTGLGLGAGCLCQMEKKSSHSCFPAWKPCPPGAWATLASVWPRTDALADAWTEAQGKEGSWEKPR